MCLDERFREVNKAYHHDSEGTEKECFEGYRPLLCNMIAICNIYHDRAVLLRHLKL